jgi:ketosteroid isomerase-like protein
METTTAVEFVNKVFEDLNRRDYARASQYFAVEVTLTGAEVLTLEGRDAVINHFQQSDAALAGSSLTLVDILTSETKVGVAFVLTGTHIGAFDLGPGKGSIPPTGRQLAVPVFWAMTIRDGKITGVVHYWDMFCLLTQLGLVPAPDQVPA